MHTRSVLKQLTCPLLHASAGLDSIGAGACLACTVISTLIRAPGQIKASWHRPRVVHLQSCNPRRTFCCRCVCMPGQTKASWHRPRVVHGTDPQWSMAHSGPWHRPRVVHGTDPEWSMAQSGPWHRPRVVHGTDPEWSMAQTHSGPWHRPTVVHGPQWSMAQTHSGPLAILQSKEDILLQVCVYAGEHVHRVLKEC